MYMTAWMAKYLTMSPDLEATRQGTTFVIYAAGGDGHFCMQTRSAIHSLEPETAMPIRLRRACIVDPPAMIGLMLRAASAHGCTAMKKMRTVTVHDLILKPEQAEMEDKSGVFHSREDLPPLLGGTLSVDFKTWIKQLLKERLVSESNVVIDI